MRFIKLSFLIALFGFTLTSCKFFQPNLMLRAPYDYKYDEFARDTIDPEYRVGVDDVVMIEIYTNDGFLMLENVARAGELQNRNVGRNVGQGRSYRVEFDGTINLPIIGRVSILGMTIRECEFFLEDKYAEFYINPFITVEVSNRKVIIFPGEPGQAQAVNLGAEQFTLLEILAQVGGIPNDGKAYKIKLIRGDVQNPQIYLFDLSKIEQLPYGNVVMESGDILYIERRIRPIQEVMSELQPIVTVTTFVLSLFTTYTIWRNVVN